MPAGDLPGDNCEITLKVKGPDDQGGSLNALWRFDKVDGRLSVVG